MKQVFISENSMNMFNSMYEQQIQQLFVMSTQSVQSFSDIFIFRSEESIQSITLSFIETISVECSAKFSSHTENYICQHFYYDSFYRSWEAHTISQYDYRQEQDLSNLLFY